MGHRMAVVIHCPQCRGCNSYEGMTDTITCISCGMKIDIIGIIGYEGYLRSGYLYLELLDFDNAYDNLVQAVRLMDEKTFMNERTELINRIVTELCSITPDSDINCGVATDLFYFANRIDSLEEGTVSHVILRRVHERLADVDPDSLSFIMEEFGDIAFASILTAPVPKSMLFAAGIVLDTINLIKEQPSNDLDVQDNARMVIERYSSVYNPLFSRLNEEISSRTEEELDACMEHWANLPALPFLEHLYEAENLSFDLSASDFWVKRRLMGKIRKEIDAFVYEYFNSKGKEDI